MLREIVGELEPDFTEAVEVDVITVSVNVEHVIVTGAVGAGSDNITDAVDTIGVGGKVEDVIPAMAAWCRAAR